ncbi:MAG: DUF6370 family protein [Bacteroidales bacterium]
MKKLGVFVIGVLITVLIACSGSQNKEPGEKDTTVKTTSANQMDQKAVFVQVAEIGCAQCQLGLPCKEHKLAAKIADKVYYVEGAGVEDLAEYDYCSVIKKATLKGHVKDSTFQTESIELAKE